MKIAVIILAVVVIVLLLVIISYRRQVKNICRQLAFINNHKTNMMVTYQSFGNVTSEMINEINQMIVENRNSQQKIIDSSNNLKEIIANLSHDIRTPLTSMDGYFQLLEESDSSDDKERYNKIIANRISSLKDMLEELFTYAKVHDESYELSLEKLELNKIVLSTLFTFYDEINKRGIEPVININDEKLFVMCNQAGMSRVLQNIIKNSYEHSKTHLEIFMGRQGDYAVLRCGNDMKNCDDIDVNRVFERFYKSDASRSNISTGLGLSITKGLVEKMHGEVFADITENVFSITLKFKIV